MRERAQRLEQWAYGALDHAPNTASAYRVLSSAALSRHLAPARDERLAGALKRTLDFARRPLVNAVAERTLNELQTIHPAGLAE